MKRRYKILIGEWVSVYKTDTAIITTDKDIENMSVDEITKLLDFDDNTDIEFCGKADYDWTTEEHEEWDTHEAEPADDVLLTPIAGGITILEKLEKKD